MPDDVGAIYRNRGTAGSHYLVAGGAGYVGSHLVSQLIDQGCQVTVLDNLRQGHRAAVARGAKLVIGDISDLKVLEQVFSQATYSAVFHFAALSLVGESMRWPFVYLEDNYIGSLRLIEAACRYGVKRFVFSSTANLFSNAIAMPITEAENITPGSPYGESKYLIERVLAWAHSIHGLRSASLRYFNAAGADPFGRFGEHHDPETHLIPLVIDAALGRRPPVTVFGTDYDTPDGTCIRDYVHVCDLAAAHVAVLDELDHRSAAYNVGTGTGYSVLEVIEAVEQVTGLDVPWTQGPRRAGDPPLLVASSEALTRDTGWTPRFATLTDIVATAYRWRLAHPHGYVDALAQRQTEPLLGAARAAVHAPSTL